MSETAKLILGVTYRRPAYEIQASLSPGHFAYFVSCFAGEAAKQTLREEKKPKTRKLRKKKKSRGLQAKRIFELVRGPFLLVGFHVCGIYPSFPGTLVNSK